MWDPSISCEASPITQADEGDLMTSTRTHTIRLLGVAAVVTLGLNAAAYGATGGTFLLGKANKADQKRIFDMQYNSGRRPGAPTGSDLSMEIGGI